MCIFSQARLPLLSVCGNPYGAFGEYDHEFTGEDYVVSQPFVKIVDHLMYRVSWMLPKCWAGFA